MERHSYLSSPSVSIVYADEGKLANDFEIRLITQCACRGQQYVGRLVDGQTSRGIDIWRGKHTFDSFSWAALTQLS